MPSHVSKLALLAQVLVIGISLAARPAHAATVNATTRFPEVVSPGQTVEIAGDFAGATVRATKVNLRLVGTDTVVEALDGQVGDPPRTIQVVLPQKLAPGRYFLSIADFDNLKDSTVPGEIRVRGDAVQLDATNPTTAYCNNRGSFDFEILGKNFATTRPKDNQVYVTGQGPIVRSWSQAGSEAECLTMGPPCLWVASSERLRVVGYQQHDYQGQLRVSVGVGGARSAETSLVLSRMSKTGILTVTIAAFALLAFVVYRLVSRGMKDRLIQGQRYSPFWSFFIDSATNSYSLSKFQLLLFSAVFVFCYLYVFLCRWLVQWVFVLPDVPATFSAILGISAGTTLLAAGAAATRGDKGAGAERPSAADFITTGGQVVPERFQFFVWTIVSSIGLIALLVNQDPATITGFPEFPSGLLYVMGISAAGYVGGKVVRDGGPVFHNIAWDGDDKKLIVQGKNLSLMANYAVDGKTLPIDTKVRESLVKGTLQDQQPSERKFCSELVIQINDATIDLTRGDHVFRLINPDGQYAETSFAVDQPTVKAMSQTTPAAGGSPATAAAGAFSVAAGKQLVPIFVTGTGFRSGMTGRWTAPTATEPTDVGQLKLVDPNTLELKLVPGNQKGIGTLLLSTPSGASAVISIAVT